MSKTSISVDQDQFSCPICLDLLNDPVSIPCGHSFCKDCINGFWDHMQFLYSCPQCRETFTPRPVLRKNNILAEVVEKLKKTELQAASPPHCYAGPGDVECDFCTGRKCKAIKSCLVCMVSLCEIHFKPHLELLALKKHNLVKPTNIQEKICSQHDKLIEIYCRTDKKCICCMCMMDEHKGHDAVAAKAERTEKQTQLKKMQKKSRHRIQEREKQVQELKQAVDTLKRSAQAAVEDSERIFTELIRSIEKKRSEVREMIRAQEKEELSRAEGLLGQVEQEIVDLKKRDTELEQLSHTDDDTHFLQSFQSLCMTTGPKDSPSIKVSQHLSFDGLRKSNFDLKVGLEKFFKEHFSNVSSHVAAVQIVLPSAVNIRLILPSEPKSRKEFLAYFRQLTLDPNTAHPSLILSEKNRVVTRSGGVQTYPALYERFDCLPQVLCKERLHGTWGRCYWEAEWSSKRCVYLAVSYKGINRKGIEKCGFRQSNQSWCLECSSTLSLWHNNTETKIPSPPYSRIGVYVDHSAGTLSFYRVSKTMTLLHRVQTTFTQPLYAGFGVFLKGFVKLRDPKQKP